MANVSPEFSNERNTLGMFGAGAIEMLAREMSAELIGIRESARAAAAAGGQPVTRDLVAKGIAFGSITIMSDGHVDPSGIEGVDWDLIVKWPPHHDDGRPGGGGTVHGPGHSSGDERHPGKSAKR